MPITVAMYQSRERFMLEALALTNDIQAYMRENGMGGGEGRGGFGRGGGPPLNGSQVRGGSLYPPTKSHREQFQLAKELFAEVRGGMDR